jgi:hypothetical protein
LAVSKQRPYGSNIAIALIFTKKGEKTAQACAIDASQNAVLGEIYLPEILEGRSLG